VYAREVDGKTLTLSVSGMLWERSLVMLDKETGSLWSHLLGEAKQGPLKGKVLKQVPSVMTDWASWSRRHPDGTVVLLSRTSEEYRREFYARPERFVLGVALDGRARAWAFDLLAKNPALEDRLNDTAVIVVFDRASVTARLYERKFEGRLLSFRMSEEGLTDKETGSTWDPLTGRATAGPSKGKSLTALPAVVSYRDAWQRFHPRSEVRSVR
jgi:hypothetical protein